MDLLFHEWMVLYIWTWYFGSEVHTFFQSGLHFWKIEKTLQEYLPEEPVSIVITTLIQNKIDIQRISSCKDEGMLTKVLI